MQVVVVGTLPPRAQRSLTAAGIDCLAGGRRFDRGKSTAVRLVVGNKPPTKPAAGPWVWCTTRAFDVAAAAAAVLAGAYDVLEANDDLGPILARRLVEITAKLEPGPPP